MPDQVGLHAVASLLKRSGIPRDVVMNTFTFTNPTGFIGTPAADAALVAAKVAAVYAQTGFAAYLSPSLTGDIHVEVFNVTSHLDGGAAGPPVLVAAYSTLTISTTTTPLPNEVAACITWHPAYGSVPEFGPGTRPRSRIRSRIYVGPFNTTAIEKQATVNEPNISSGLIGHLTGMGVIACTPIAGGWVLGAWSRRNQAITPVNQGWVDYEPDTQRRRGRDPQLRETFSV
jgi:hypothetical protein